MSKRNAIIFVLVLLILLGVGFFAFYSYLNRNTPDTPISPTPSPIDIFPFPDGNPTTPPSTRPPTSGGTDNTNIKKLRKISSDPISGAIATSDNAKSFIRFAERRTAARLYEVSGSPEKKTLVASTNIPKVVYESLWNSKGNGLIMRYLKDDGETIETFSAKLTTPATPAKDESTDSAKKPESLELEGVFLPVGISTISMSPKKDKIFYVTGGETGSVGTVANPDGTRKIEVWSSPAREWLSVWPSADVISLTTKPSGTAKGFSYLLNTRSGSFSKIIGGLNGLAVLPSPDVHYALYSVFENSALTLNILNLVTDSKTAAPLATLADKCVWGSKRVTILYCAVPRTIPSGTYPDDWYLGVVSFADELWKIDAVSGEADLMLKPEQEGGEALDITNLSLDEQEKTLLFQNKKDLSLWAFTLQ